MFHHRQDREGITEAMSFYSELKRRNVLRVAAGYIVSAWLLIQVAETIFPLFGFGDGPARIVVILLVIGFLPALIVSWIFELTPGGLLKDKDVDRRRPSVAGSAKRFDRTIMLVLVLAVSYFAFDKFILSESREQAIAETAREAGMFDALAAYTSNESIAVLPFADMSAEQDQEYFADGITEELLNQLAQLEGLNVTGRTSSFAFKGHNQDLKSIGEQLGVTNLLEGSVRKDGDSIRITAQLINSQTGFHLWSDTYDRKISDIFDIQEDIARSVAGALSIVLDVDDRSKLPGTGTDVVEAYDVYLEAQAGPWELAKARYQQAIDLDPNYAEAYASLAQEIGMDAFNLGSEEARAAQEHARQLVVRAIEIDPDLASPHRLLSIFQWAGGDWIGATELYENYQSLAPADISGQLGFESVLKRTGHIRAVLRIAELDFLKDPLNIFAAHNLAELYIQSGRYEDALSALAQADQLTPPPEQGNDLRRFFLSVSVGEPEGIRTALRNYAVADPHVATLVNAILDEFDSAPAVVLEVMRQAFENDVDMRGEGRLIIASMAAHYGDAEFALEIMSDELSVNLIRMHRLWYPFFSEMRSLPGFKTLVQRAGLVDYWRVYGWADTCRPLGEQDFECD